ncbi:hypothetical protein H0H93_012511 [Arthromyces matolae]|nr:hypothetical protein H0H93_012511 [Arthromyces matolae]
MTSDNVHSSAMVEIYLNDRGVTLDVEGLAGEVIVGRLTDETAVEGNDVDTTDGSIDDEAVVLFDGSEEKVWDTVLRIGWLGEIDSVVVVRLSEEPVVMVVVVSVENGYVVNVIHEEVGVSVEDDPEGRLLGISVDMPPDVVRSVFEVEETASVGSSDEEKVVEDVVVQKLNEV